jgi:NAD(P)-dependent dehydrogenase (short-subunit alcohol dehydrogenase family)
MRTVVITGANAGIGFATAKFLAAIPDWHVVLACRNESKARAAIHDIKQCHRDSRVSFAPLDLLSLTSVRVLPRLLAEMRLPELSGLILNAGGPNMARTSPEFTEDGYEKTFQLNFLGHFLLTNLLIMNMSAGSRVVFVSSDLHDPAATKMGKIMPPKFGPVEDLARSIGTAAKLKPMARYATAKLYAMMAAYELDRRLKLAGKSITVNAWSPGVVPTTQAGRGINPVMKRLISARWFVNFMGSHLSTEREAAQALGELLVSSKYADVSGKYFDGFNEILSSDESRDEKKARAVWEQGLTLAGLPLTNSGSVPLKAVLGHSVADVPAPN